LGRRWLNACQTTKAGPIPNVANACLALRNDPAWAGRLRYDEMLRCSVLDTVAVQDITVFRIHEWLQENGLKRIGVDAVREAVEIVAQEPANRFHPLRERLEALLWDGVPRLTEWMIEFLGAEDNEYHRQIGLRFPIAMVARVFSPGCKADHMMVLEGPQGALKSQVIEALAAPYYSDNLPDLGGDPIRLSMHLRGKWLIEVSELKDFSKVDAAHLKAFITRKEEIYTPKYGHKEVTEPRQCLLVGTTNDDQYLKDETGNRRYWPVKCGMIDLDGLRAAAGQLLAEAVTEFRKATPWWLEAAVEDAFFRPEQAKRLWVDAIEPKVRGYLTGRARVLLMEIAEDLGFTASKFTVQDQRRLAAVMRHCGWELKRSSTARFWEPV